jgi:transformer-2 protein
MATTEDATRCIQELNGLVCTNLAFSRVLLTQDAQDLNGRRIRVDYSVTDRPHAPTPGEYMGHRRRDYRDSYSGSASGRDSHRDSRDPRDRDRGGDRGDRDYRDRRSDRDRDPYGRDRERDTWRDRRSPPPARGGRYSPEPVRRRRSYSRSPPRGSSPAPRREYDGEGGGPSRW